MTSRALSEVGLQRPGQWDQPHSHVQALCPGGQGLVLDLEGSGEVSPGLLVVSCCLDLGL